MVQQQRQGGLERERALNQTSMSTRGGINKRYSLLVNVNINFMFFSTQLALKDLYYMFHICSKTTGGLSYAVGFLRMDTPS